MDWNRGMDDAEAGELPAQDRSRDYREGYYFACAANYEYIGMPRESVGEGYLPPEPEIHQQLIRLNSALLAGNCPDQAARAIPPTQTASMPLAGT